MPYVIENSTGRERFITADLLQSALDSGGFSLAENQQIMMDDGKGSVVKVSSGDYSSVVDKGGRPLTSDERMPPSRRLDAVLRDLDQARHLAFGLGGRDLVACPEDDPSVKPGGGELGRVAADAAVEDLRTRVRARLRVGAFPACHTCIAAWH